MTLIHVTEVLDAIRNPALETWRGTVGNREANRISKEARTIGTDLHKWMQTALGKPSQTDSTKTPASFATCQVLKAGDDWLRGNKTILTPLAIEETLTYAPLGLIGTPDLVTLDTIYDWKTSSAIRWDHLWQVNTYMMMATAHYGRTITQGMLVRFDKELGTFSETPLTYSQPMFEAFAHLVTWYRYWKGWKEAYETPDAKVSP